MSAVMMRNNTLPAPGSKEMRRFHPHASSSRQVQGMGIGHNREPATINSNNRLFETRMAPTRMTMPNRAIGLFAAHPARWWKKS
jgi:hypothetical protein